MATGPTHPAAEGEDRRWDLEVVGPVSRGVGGEGCERGTEVAHEGAFLSALETYRT